MANLVKQWPNYLTHWPPSPVLRISFVQYLIAFCSQPEVTSDIISSRFVGQVVPDNRVKFGDPPRLSHSGEIPPEASEAAVSTVFFAVASDRK